MRWVLPLALLAAACGDPSAPQLPPRDQIGPPDEAAKPEACVPPYPMGFGDEWYLLADLDRGVACFAYLERDECILGVFIDCTDPSEDRRQWQGRVTNESIAELAPVYRSAQDSSRLTRPPRCCHGAVVSSGTTSYARLDCQLATCRHPADLSHAGLYFERYDPAANPAAAIAATSYEASGLVDVAFDPEAQRLWAVSSDALYSFAVDGTRQMQSSLSGATIVAARGGIAYAAADRQLVVASAGGTTTVDLPGPVQVLHARPSDALLVVDVGGSAALWQVDGATATRTASASLALTVTALTGDGPTYAIGDDELVHVVQGNLHLQLQINTLTDEDRSGGFVPRGAAAYPGGVALLGRCHVGSGQDVRCVHESGGTVPLRRHAVAGAEVLAGIHLDLMTNRWITVSTAGQVTQIDRADGRPHLQNQVRLAQPYQASAYDPVGRRLFVLSEAPERLLRVDLDMLP